MGKFSTLLEGVLTIFVKQFGGIPLLKLGVGGLPRGWSVVCYDQESSGPTPLALHAIANAQKTGGSAAFIDAEHAFDPVFARQIGVDLDNLLLAQPASVEEAVRICKLLVRSGAVDVIIVDSLAALALQTEGDEDGRGDHVGLRMRFLTQAMRRLTATLSPTRTLCFFANRTRSENIPITAARLAA